MSTTTLPQEEVKIKKLPPYNVILLNDDDHSVDYVIKMLKELFGHPEDTGFKMAQEVHETGRVIVKTCSKELAELKMEQIHAYGPDKTIPRCKGSMSSEIEPAA